VTRGERSAEAGEVKDIPSHAGPKRSGRTALGQDGNSTDNFAEAEGLEKAGIFPNADGAG
jgi:hypothetical protein